MGGKYINKTQAELYMKYRKQSHLTQEAASAKAGFSVRSGRIIEQNKHHSAQPRMPRSYKTRTSKIDEVWDSVLEPMLQASPDLQAKTLFLYLQRMYTDSDGYPVYSGSIERTLQRRVAKWQALNGKDKEVMFPQVHIPGQQGLSDFSHFTNAKITIQKQNFKHMFYHFRLVYSKWSYLKVIQSGESMQALSEGLQEALFCLGGAPIEHRTDSLSAAFKNLSSDAQKDLTSRYTDLCAYYNMCPTRNNKGKSHENGSVESSHGHLKNRIRQELILRGSNDFDSIEQYEEWVHKIVVSSNKRNAVDFKTEISALQSLPINKTVDYEVKSIKVNGSSIIVIRGMHYSVPSTFSGHTLTLHIYQSKLQAYLGSTFVFELSRKYFTEHKSMYVIDYRHIVKAMLRKPGAFRNCLYRDEIFPNSNYEVIWQHLDKSEHKNVAPKIMLRLLKIAADNNCETELSLHVTKLVKDEGSFDIGSIESCFNRYNNNLPEIICEQHSINCYDFLNTIITGEQHAIL
jgi:hypothetical protein